MSALARIVRTYPITVFAVLACLFGWGIFIAAGLGLGSHPDNMPLGPLFAALVVVSCQGRKELFAWGRRLRRWGAAPKWYAVAVLTPIAVHVVDVLVNHWFGAALPTAAQLGPLAGRPRRVRRHAGHGRDRRGGRLDGVRGTLAAAPERALRAPGLCSRPCGSCGTCR